MHLFIHNVMFGAVRTLYGLNSSDGEFEESRLLNLSLEILCITVLLSDNMESAASNEVFNADSTAVKFSDIWVGVPSI